MSRVDVERFALAVQTDKQLREDLRGAATSNEALIQFANSKGYDFQLDELAAYAEEKMADVSEEELDKVAGGKGWSHPLTKNLPGYGQTKVQVTAVEVGTLITTTAAVTEVAEGVAGVTTVAGVAEGVCVCLPVLVL